MEELTIEQGVRSMCIEMANQYAITLMTVTGQIYTPVEIRLLAQENYRYIMDGEMKMKPNAQMN